MLRHRLASLVLALAIADGARAASLTPPNLVTASTLNNPDLLLVWPYAAGGPLEAMSWATFKVQMQAALGSSYLTPGNNLSDLGNPTTARTNLGLGTAALANTGTSGASVPFLNGVNTWSGVQSFNAGDLVVKGAISGALTINCATTCGSRTLTLPAGTTDFSTTGGTSQVVKQASAGAALTVGQLACADLSDGGQGGCAAKVVTGSITPTLAYSTPGTSSFSYASQGGAYACIGGVVTGYAHVTFTPTNGTASGNLTWANPPYSILDSGNVSTIGNAALFGTWASLNSLPYAASGTAFASFSGTTVSFLGTTNSSSGSSKTINWTFSYMTSAC